MSPASPLGDDEALWRRVHSTHLKQDGTVSTAAFRGVEMSVDRAVLQREMSVTLAGGAGIASFDAGGTRALGQEPVADPQPGNTAHALVIGPKPRSIQRQLRDISVFIERTAILRMT